MPAETLSALYGRLCCPRCRSALAGTGHSLRCGSSGCELSAVDFPVVDGSPALIDYADSLARPPLSEPAAGPAPASDTTPGRPGRGWLARRQRPVNTVAQRNIERLLAEVRLGRPQGRPRVLVVGGASVGNGVEELYAAPDVDLACFDLAYSRHCQLLADAHRIPFVDGSFDAVVVQAVLEHVLDPRQVVAEIHRVLAPSGVVYAETPFMQQVHEGAYDFQRFTHSGHRWLFKDFGEIDSGPVAGPGTTLQWAVDYAVRAATGSRRAGVRSRAVTRPLARLDRRLARDRAVDGACACWFLGRRSDSPMPAADIVPYYAGVQRP